MLRFLFKKKAFLFYIGLIVSLTISDKSFSFKGKLPDSSESAVQLQSSIGELNDVGGEEFLGLIALFRNAMSVSTPLGTPTTRTSKNQTFLGQDENIFVYRGEMSVGGHLYDDINEQRDKYLDKVKSIESGSDEELKTKLGKLRDLIAKWRVAYAASLTQPLIEDGDSSFSSAYLMDALLLVLGKAEANPNQSSLAYYLLDLHGKGVITNNPSTIDGYKRELIDNKTFSMFMYTKEEAESEKLVDNIEEDLIDGVEKSLYALEAPLSDNKVYIVFYYTPGASIDDWEAELRSQLQISKVDIAKPFKSGQEIWFDYLKFMKTEKKEFEFYKSINDYYLTVSDKAQEDKTYLSTGRSAIDSRITELIDTIDGKENLKEILNNILKESPTDDDDDTQDSDQ